MANNYQQSSFQIDLRNEEEGKFLIEKMVWYEAIVSGEHELLLEDDEEHEFTDIEKQLCEEGWGWNYEKEGNQLVIFCEEGGQIDVMAGLLQDFLQKFRPNECIVFTWSYTCSKMRPGEFGGGGALVGPTSILYMDIQDELSKLAKNRAAIAEALSSLPD